MTADFHSPRDSSPARVFGIKEIAKALGVSIGTVDRALHDRPGINPMTRAKVLKMAQTMGYRPNLAARWLKSQKQLVISVQLPAEIASFFDALRQGISDAATPFEPAIRLDFRTYPSLGVGDAEVFAQALIDGCNGIIIAPGEPGVVKPLIRRAARKHIPVVCVATDAPGTERLAAVSACPFTNGAMAGELFARFLAIRGQIAVVTGSLSTEDHAQKLRGFRESLSACGDTCEVVSIIEAHDDGPNAYRQTKEMLRTHPRLHGIYVCTANSLPVMQAVEEAGLGSKIEVIATDLFPELVPLIRSGRVKATMHQRPRTQGRLAFAALYRFLVEGKCPLPRIRVAPHVVMNSNLSLFLDRILAEPEDLSEALPTLNVAVAP
jgi:LacI family transcriptional regulator